MVGPLLRFREHRARLPAEAGYEPLVGLVALRPCGCRVRDCRARVLPGALPELRGRVSRLVADGHRHPGNLWGGSGEEARGTLGLDGGVRRPERRRVGVRAARPPVTLAAIMGLIAAFAIVTGVALLMGAFK